MSIPALYFDYSHLTIPILAIPNHEIFNPDNRSHLLNLRLTSQLKSMDEIKSLITFLFYSKRDQNLKSSLILSPSQKVAAPSLSLLSSPTVSSKGDEASRSSSGQRERAASYRQEPAPAAPNSNTSSKQQQPQATGETTNIGQQGEPPAPAGDNNSNNYDQAAVPARRGHVEQQLQPVRTASNQQQQQPASSTSEPRRTETSATSSRRGRTTASSNQRCSNWAVTAPAKPFPQNFEFI